MRTLTIKSTTMKIILLIATTIVISSVYGYLPDEDYGEEFLALSKTLHKKCVAIMGVTLAEIDSLKNGIFDATEQMKRYVLCLWLVSEEMNTDLTMNHKLLTKYMPKKVKNGVKIYERCNKEARESSEAEPYEIIFDMMKCYYNADPEHFIMF
ncbi:uncharacterized protein isoform X1 [Leptinotarsa decemlineata]|uniref:uncharacterized protein isoform X1 n=2 Tax=Leptinotarsa decemlineata TaxID=7539 RepID=UPI003D306710